MDWYYAGGSILFTFLDGAHIRPLYADARERKRPHYGRGEVLIVGVVCGTIIFLFHGARRVFDGWLVNSVGYHFAVQSGYAACFAIMFPVLDGMTVDNLQRRDGDSKEYGKERLFGAVSWGITNLILGPLIDHYGIAIYYPCALVAAIYSVLSILIYSRAEAASTTTTPVPTASEDSSKREEEKDDENNKEKKGAPSTLSLAFAVFGTAYGAAFCFSYFVLNTGFSVVENLAFLFFEFQGGSNTVCAITVGLTVMFEIPMFHIAPVVLRKYGVGVLLLSANVAVWIRVTGYTLIPQGQAMWVFLLEPLHGFTYAGAQSAAVEYINQHVPQGSEASGQGIVNFVRGLASVLGLWLGGFLQDAFGPRVMYRVFVAAITIGMGIFASVRCRYRQEESYERIPDDEGNFTV
jgi:hypothetical protein